MADENSSKKIATHIDLLEKRVSELENERKKYIFNYVSISAGEAENVKGYCRYFDFVTFTDCNLLLSVLPVFSGDTIKACVKVNGLYAFSCENCISGTEINAELPLKEGATSVEVFLTSQTLFSVESCVFNTFGPVGYKPSDDKLSVVNGQQESLLLMKRNDEATLYLYDAGGLNEKMHFLSVKDCCVCKMSQNYAVAYRDYSDRLLFCKLSNTIQPYKTIVVDAGINSLCASGGEACAVFAVKGNRVYKYCISDDLTFVKTDTGLTARYVTADPSDSGAILLVDFDGSARLIDL